MTNSRYLIVTTTIRDQNISDSTPRTFSVVTGMPWVPEKHSRRA
jgi:hypothetical protein